MKTRRLAIPCPRCGSPDVVYTCTPNCCFNHVCTSCGATFEPSTVAAGDRLAGVQPPVPPPEASDPTAPCARCDSPTVYMTEEGAPVCGTCGALLRLEIEQT